MPADLLHRATTRVMSCDATVLAQHDDDQVAAHAIAGAVHRLHRLDRLWSRFRSTSEVSGLNRAGGDARRVSDDTIRLLDAMVAGWSATDGAFDPTLLGPLVGLGYATSRDDGSLRTSLDASVRPGGRVDRVRIDRSANTVRLPVGTVIDPGGIGKGLAADLVVDELLAAGCDGALVEIGGDVRVGGRAPADAGWSIAVPSVDGAGGRSVVRLAAGAVATSGVHRRQWVTDGQHHHHLIDPVRQRPTDHGVHSCTVVAGTGAWAEVFTKVAFVRGADQAIEVYERRGLAAAVTTASGELRTTSAWSEFGS